MMRKIHIAENQAMQLIVMGAVLMVLGVLAVLSPVAATVVVEASLGAILALAGVINIVRALTNRDGMRSAATLLFGLMLAAAGGLLLMYPTAGTLGLIAAVAGILFAIGVIKLAYAFLLRNSRSALWLAAVGALSLLLALAILSEWPSAAQEFIGVLVGIDLLCSGVWMTAFGASVRHGNLSDKPPGHGPSEQTWR